MRTSPTEDNLSPSFWTCFSHYHEKVATLRSAFFDITHSERKKHSSLLGVLLTEMPPAPKKKHSSLLGVLLREMKHSGRKKHSSLLGVLLTEMPPAPKKTSLVVRNVFEGDETQRKKKALLFVGSAFFWS